VKNGSAYSCYEQKNMLKLFLKTFSKKKSFSVTGGHVQPFLCCLGLFHFLKEWVENLEKKDTARSRGHYTLTKPVAMAIYPKQEEASLSKGHF
jgi:hypothetical protein